MKVTLAVALSMLMVLTSTPVSAASNKLWLTKKTVSIKKGRTLTVKIRTAGHYKFKKAVVKKNSNKRIANVTIKKSKVTVKGSITNITFDNSNKVNVTVKNETEKAINSLSYISYKCYDSADIVTKTGNLYLEALNNGESCNVFLYKTSSTVKVVFNGSSVKKGNESEYQEMTEYGSYLSNSLPYETNGLSITNITFDTLDKVYVSVKNNTGNAISSSSYISYKCYDSAGIVTKTSKLYLEDINNGETCKVFFHKTPDTMKIVFGGSSVKYGEENDSQETTTYGSYISNVLPYETKELSITNITFDRLDKVYVTVKNNTGDAISSSSYISYKCYDLAGTVTKTGKLNLENMNK